MSGVNQGKRIGVYCNPGVKTSGQRFFSSLMQQLSEHSVPFEDSPDVILFNVSAPLKVILLAKLKGRKIVVRIDSLYFDRLSPQFLSTFHPLIRSILSFGLRWRMLNNAMAFWANFFNRNYGAFIRLILANAVVYQSTFSKKIYSRFFPGKKNAVIVNGARYMHIDPAADPRTENEIKIAVIYDEGRPSKRIYEIVKFVQWANESMSRNIQLVILGYTGNLPECVPAELTSLISRLPYITTLGRFSELDAAVRKTLAESDMYMTLSFKDACPNVVVEAMAHGLPVVGLASGGVGDIVGNAGVLLPSDDFGHGFYSAHRFEYDFPPFSYEKMLEGVEEIFNNRDEYRRRVALRFEKELDMEVVASKYFSVLQSQ